MHTSEMTCPHCERKTLINVNTGYCCLGCGHLYTPGDRLPEEICNEINCGGCPEDGCPYALATDRGGERSEPAPWEGPFREGTH